MTTVTMGKALNLALHDALQSDDRVLVFGEDVGKLGGVFRVTDGRCGTHRAGVIHLAVPLRAARGA